MSGTPTPTEWPIRLKTRRPTAYEEVIEEYTPESIRELLAGYQEDGDLCLALLAREEALRAEVARLRDWQEAVADGLGFLARPEGQSGTAIGTPEVIIAAWEQMAAESREVATLRQQQTPQPIETAPKDGTRILAYEPGYGWVIVWWGEHMAWLNSFSVYHGSVLQHWLPLPPPPHETEA